MAPVIVLADSGWYTAPTQFGYCAGPSMHSPFIGLLVAGDQFREIKNVKDEDGRDWVLIETKTGKQGWTFLSWEDVTTRDDRGRTIYSEPSFDSKVVTRLKDGDSYRDLEYGGWFEEHDMWLRIKTKNGQTGWVTWHRSWLHSRARGDQ